MPARAAEAVRLDHHVPDLAPGAATVVQLAVEDEAAADARADPNAEHVAVRPARAAGVLAEDADVHVVADLHRDTAEQRRDLRGELDALLEAGDVRGEEDGSGLGV